MRYPIILLAFAYSLLTFVGCKQSKTEGEYEVKEGITYYSGKKTNNLIFQVGNDPESMALWQQQTGSRKDLKAYVHGWLYYNQDDGSQLPGIAKGDMQVSPDGLTYTVEIHPEAKWEDGTPITAEDALFSLKVAICPLTENSSTGGYMEFLKDLKIDPSNPKKFQLEMKSYYMMNDIFLCNFPIIDKRVYDSEHIIDKYSLEQLRQPATQLSKDAILQNWVKSYTDVKFGRDPKFVKGSGMYELASWTAGQEIILKRKANFWAKNLHGKYYDQYPDSITFKVVKEATAIEMGFKQEQLDVSITPTATLYKKFQNDPQIQKNYVLRDGLRFTYTLAAFNLHPNSKKSNPAIQDLNVRKAIAHLIPVQEIIDQITEGFGSPIASPAFIQSPQYNQKLRPIPFNLPKADSLLAAAGWKDSDGDKMLDKVINGKKTKLNIALSYNAKAGNSELILKRVQTELQKAGINATLDPLEQNALMDKLNTKNFDMIFIALTPGSTLVDFKEGWSRAGGSNYAGFGTPETDQLIEQIRTTQDKKQFKILSDSIQQIIYDQQPVVFFYTARGRMIVHRRFNHIEQLEFSSPALNTLEMRRK